MPTATEARRGPADCIVVGSGPAGVACAAALLAHGRSVRMLDAGVELDPDRATAVAAARAAEGDWRLENAATLAPWHAESEDQAAAKIPTKLVFGSDYPYRDAEAELGIVSEGSALQASLARGGLSNVWGAAMLPYHDRDIADWPITSADLAPHYAAAMAMTGGSARRDDLDALLPLYGEPAGALPLSRQAARMAETLARHRDALRAAGIEHGQGRVAIRPPTAEASGCSACGMCLSGCPFGHIYSATRTIAELARSERFSLESDAVVTHVEERGDQAVVRGRRRGSDEPFEATGARVFLACGVIPTTGILLRSLGAYDRTVHILDSQYFLLPALLTSGASGVEKERLHTLSQLFLEILDERISPHLVHAQVYTYNTLIGARVRATLGPLADTFGGALARQANARLIAFQGYVHSNHSSRLAVTLRKTSPRDALDIAAEINPEAARTVRKVAGKLLRNSLKIGAVPLTPMLEVSEPGRGFHAGGSLPMRAAPGAFETDALGRPAGWSRVHAVDASVLPSIAATTITFTVMANAHRIASAAASLEPSEPTMTDTTDNVPTTAEPEASGDPNASADGGARSCLLTGANGYLGGVIAAALRSAGWRVTELVRTPTPGADAMEFHLGEPVEPAQLEGYDALVHCAYDQKALTWDEIVASNVHGSRALLRAAKDAGIANIVYISTISAFDGCTSRYGRGKLEVEETARELGAWIIRPGLVYGDAPGGAFGNLVDKVRASSTLPMPGSGGQLQVLVHEDDLAEAIRRCAAGERPVSAEPVTVAHPEPWTFRALLEEIAEALGRPVKLIPAPWQLMWLALRAAEMVKVPLGARSDSLISLNNQNPAPDLNAPEALGVECRPFAGSFHPGAE